jgi:hypothetical protein
MKMGMKNVTVLMPAVPTNQNSVPVKRVKSSRRATERSMSAFSCASIE